MSRFSRSPALFKARSGTAPRPRKSERQRRGGNASREARPAAGSLAGALGSRPTCPGHGATRCDDRPGAATRTAGGRQQATPGRSKVSLLPGAGAEDRAGRACGGATRALVFAASRAGRDGPSGQLHTRPPPTPVRHLHPRTREPSRGAGACALCGPRRARGGGAEPLPNRAARAHLAQRPGRTQRWTAGRPWQQCRAVRGNRSSAKDLRYRRP